MEEFELTILPIESLKEISIISKEVCIKEKQKIQEPIGVLENTYGIDYCIRMLEVIQNECYKHRLQPTHLYLTLEHSLKKMISHLRREKSKM